MPLKDSDSEIEKGWGRLLPWIYLKSTTAPAVDLAAFCLTE